MRMDSPDEENYVLLIDDNGTFSHDSSFVKSVHGNYLWKKIAIGELTNAFEVKTFGKFKGIDVEVFEKSVPTTLSVATRDPRDAAIAGLVETNTNWFTLDIASNAVHELRERYFPSKYSVPLPANMSNR